MTDFNVIIASDIAKISQHPQQIACNMKTRAMHTALLPGSRSQINFV